MILSKMMPVHKASSKFDKPFLMEVSRTGQNESKQVNRIGGRFI